MSDRGRLGFNVTVNERLRKLLQHRGLTVADLADACAVDPKTAGRWITNSQRIPHREHRWKAARLLDVDESYLWPPSDETSVRAPENSELMGVYPNRASVPRDVWLELLEKAQEHIDILVFSGTFLAQSNPHICEMLAERGSDGVRVRVCFGDPSSRAVETRDQEEGLAGTLSAKIRASLTYFTELREATGCEVRLHSTTLYASMFRYDDVMLANPHIWGVPASANPVLSLRKVHAGGWFQRYAQSFDAVWDSAEEWKF